MTMREPTFLILTALAARPRHGYAIMQDVETLSGGRVTLRASTLYAALDRLTADGLVEVEREEVVDGRLRRYHRLTQPGSARLHAEVEHLERNAAAARRQFSLGDLAAGTSV
jgi:DNA-binding PadR family transcriptional regulator